MNDVREQGTKKRKQGKRKEVLCEEVAEKRQREYNIYVFLPAP